MTAWTAPHRPTLAVIGPRALRCRLTRTGFGVLEVLPSSASVDEADALLLARSSLEAGSWAGALRPTGFDRGAVLAQVLRDARARTLPVVLLEDLAASGVDGWHGMLDGAVDDALVLGPLGAGQRCWHPGLHWDELALRLAATAVSSRGPGSDRVAAEIDARGAQEDWTSAQRRAVAAGRVTLDVADPWCRHLAGELVLLGVDVRDRAGAPVALDDVATPRAAATWLSDHLGLPAPPTPEVAVHERGAPDARAATACVAAVDRLGGDATTPVRLKDTIALPAGIDRTIPMWPRAATVDLGALA